MSKRLLALNVVLVGLAALLAVWLVRDLAAQRPLPPAPAPRMHPAAAAPEEPAQDPAAAEKLASYNVIVAKYLFNQSRSEAGATAAAPTPPPPPLPPKPTLLGVVLDGGESRAYLEDAVTKRVFGYQVGDSVAGGRLEKITQDRVVISRPDGQIDLLLRDPTKPKPAAGPTPQTPGAPSGAGQPARPIFPGMTPPAVAPQPGAEGTGSPRTVQPRAIRRVPQGQTPEGQSQESEQ